jgi:hypothetical protein
VTTALAASSKMYREKRTDGKRMCKVEHFEKDLKGCGNGSETNTGTESGSRRSLCGLHRRTMYLADAIATTKYILDTT